MNRFNRERCGDDRGHVMYRFVLVCPRCNKTSETVSDQRETPPHVNCGDCLMSDVEIVEMKVASVAKAQVGP